MLEPETETTYEAVLHLKNIMLARPITASSDDRGYSRRRQRLMAEPEVKDRIPTCVKTCGTLDEFWSFIQSGYPSYGQRRDYISKAFVPLIEYEESKEKSPVGGAVEAAFEAEQWRDPTEAWRKVLARSKADRPGALTSARLHLFDITALIEYPEPGAQEVDRYGEACGYHLGDHLLQMHGVVEET